MFVKHRYSLGATLQWSRRSIYASAAWGAFITGLHELCGMGWLALPWLPISAIAVAVAFYLGFKNNASYDRMWEARKIWGAIVNASRSWAFGSRDLLGANSEHADEALAPLRRTLILRHVAWMDALRFQLRKLESWEHCEPALLAVRKALPVPELTEDLREVLAKTLDATELEAVLQKINPAAHLLSNQSQHLRELRRRGLLDGFSHTHLQGLLDELMSQQGKAERIKKFPFPRQYATVNRFFAFIFTGLVPFGLLAEFEQLGPGYAWATVPFSALVGWVFLTTDKIGDWSENPFEGLHNDVPISSMSRGIERDIREMLGETELPPAREVQNDVMM